MLTTLQVKRELDINNKRITNQLLVARSAGNLTLKGPLMGDPQMSHVDFKK